MICESAEANEVLEIVEDASSSNRLVCSVLNCDPESRSPMAPDLWSETGFGSKVCIAGKLSRTTFGVYALRAADTAASIREGEDGSSGTTPLLPCVLVSGISGNGSTARDFALGVGGED